MELERAETLLPDSLSEFKHAGKGISGLKNLGNTCYLNSSIQCLSNTLPLTEYLLKGTFKKYLSQHTDDQNNLPGEIYLLIHYLNLLSGLWDDDDDPTIDPTGYVISPKTFTRIFTKFFPEGGVFRQNDSQESIVYLLDTFHELISRPVSYKISGTAQNEFDKMMVKSIQDWAKHFKNTHSFILDLFYGQEHLRLQCLHCKQITHNFPPFMYTCLPVSSSKTKTIYDCFDRHCKVEQLDADNAWECDKCKQKTQAYKKTAYWKLPQILIVTLNRFQIRESHNYQWHVKSDAFIEYPLINLDLSDYVTNPQDSAKYNLYAICCHVGSTYYGHYYSYCLNSNGKWYEFNDDVVKEVINLNDVITEDAYVLFYQKV